MEQDEISRLMQLEHDNGYNEGYHDVSGDWQDDCFSRMRKHEADDGYI
jgi:hypothetical protein